MSLISYFLEYNRYMNFGGILAVLAVAALFSRKRSAINYRLTLMGLCMQFAIALAILHTTIGHKVIAGIADGVAALYRAADQGVSFLFGSLADASGAWGFIFAVKVLPIIVFFGAFMSLLYYFGIIQRFVIAINYLVQPVLGTTGPETLCAVANSFLGQTEAPLVIRHYLARMTKSEMLVVMVSGMGTISGSILAVYASIGVPAQHLLAASMMAIPATIIIAKILYPADHEEVAAEETVKVEAAQGNVFDALAQGTSDGLMLALNVGAMLIAFLSLIGLINSLLAVVCGWAGFAPWSLQMILGYICTPIGWLMGLSGQEMAAASELVGIKVAVNEMVAFMTMLSMQLSERTVAILTYALCGFSNFSCIGIQIGGIGALVPSKRAVLSELGLYAVLGGALANLLSAFMVGLLL